MGRSKESFYKKEIRKKKIKKRNEKVQKKLERKENEKNSTLDNMIAYVDERGMITSTPPDPDKKEEVKLEDIEIGVSKKKSIKDLDPNRTGILDFYNEVKGYGFIIDSETKESVFMHINNALEKLKQGNKVSFIVEMGPKGSTAMQVKPIK